MAEGILISPRDAQRLQNMLRWFERGGNKPILRRRGILGGGTNIKIFKVHSLATGDGIYNCYEQVIVDADWNNTGGAAKIWDKDEEPVAVEVLNLDEYNPNAGQHNLIEGDVIVACYKVDDAGVGRWVGLPAISGGGIHKAYCKTNALESSTIVCYLDEDLESPPQDPPPEEITVHCLIFAATVLSECFPPLSQHDLINVYYIDEEWWCNGWFSGYIDCVPPE